MSTAEFRFYEELNDYLQASRRKRSFTHTFAGAPAIKDTIEALSASSGSVGGEGLPNSGDARSLL